MIRAGIKRRYIAWLDRRIPRQHSVRLDQRRIFIFPSRVGLAYLSVLLLVLLAAINFENSMAFALAFWLAALFVVAILHTYANVSGIGISVKNIEPAFCAARIQVPVVLSTHRKTGHRRVEVGWSAQDYQSIDLCPDGVQELLLSCPAVGRGWFYPERILIQSYYPLGVLCAWSWVSLDARGLVYPLPIEHPMHLTESGVGEGQLSLDSEGVDEFYDTRDYQQGDNLRHVNWKRMAKGLPAQTKLFSASADHITWLSWASFAPLEQEQRLSALCFWVLRLHEQGGVYGLRLGGEDFGPGSGWAFRNQLLEQLALYGLAGQGGD